MVDSGVVVKITYKEACVLDEKSGPVQINDLGNLIALLKDTQQKTNDCLTRLTKETCSTDGGNVENDKFDDLSEDDSEEDTRCVIEPENDISPKRVKLKN